MKILCYNKGTKEKERNKKCFNLSNKIGYTQIPLPPINIQQKIISECEAIDAEYNTSRMTIETYRQKISDIFDELEVLAIDKVGGGKNA